MNDNILLVQNDMEDYQKVSCAQKDASEDKITRKNIDKEHTEAMPSQASE
jgi:hypothetical protein